ncbi:MAG TPA: c-type cytochrome [Candidatus Angelobacter sp.]|nr:c-type cytochrome [Candidatus Angelobacter sp.]
MKLYLVAGLAASLLLSGCSNNSSAPAALVAKAYGAQIIEVSGGKQVGGVGSHLPDSVVVQVNGTDGNAVTGALVSFRGDGLSFNPAQALSDSSGQVTTMVSLGAAPGDYQLIAETPKPVGGSASLALREIALGYQQKVGREVNEQYCIRCHDQESTTERVSNFDNLTPQPHAFTDGNYLNKISDGDLITIITQGGPALKKSAETPAYGSTLSAAEIKAVVAYMRAIADPPYTPQAQRPNGATK